MTRSFGKLSLAIAGLALVGACAGGDDTNTVSDTTTMPGMDTVNMPMAVPTTDTLVTTKQVETDTNVIRGNVNRDTLRRTP